MLSSPRHLFETHSGIEHTSKPATQRGYVGAYFGYIGTTYYGLDILGYSRTSWIFGYAVAAPARSLGRMSAAL